MRRRARSFCWRKAVRAARDRAAAPVVKGLAARALAVDHHPPVSGPRRGPTDPSRDRSGRPPRARKGRNQGRNDRSRGKIASGRLLASSAPRPGRIVTRRSVPLRVRNVQTVKSVRIGRSAQTGRSVRIGVRTRSGSRPSGRPSPRRGTARPSPLRGGRASRVVVRPTLIARPRRNRADAVRMRPRPNGSPPLVQLERPRPHRLQRNHPRRLHPRRPRLRRENRVRPTRAGPLRPPSRSTLKPPRRPGLQRRRLKARLRPPPTPAPAYPVDRSFRRALPA